MSEDPATSREELYVQQMEEARVRLTKMREQVEILKEREGIYQQRLEEANQELANSLAPGTFEQQEAVYLQKLSEAETLLNRTRDRIAQSNSEAPQLQQENLALRNSVEAYQQQEQQYRQQVSEASDLLQQAYGQISQFKAQNDLLLQREQEYQRQIADLNGNISDPGAQLSGQTVADNRARHYEHEDEEDEEDEHERH